MKTPMPTQRATSAMIWPRSGLRARIRRRPSGPTVVSGRVVIVSTPPTPSGTMNQKSA